MLTFLLMVVKWKVIIQLVSKTKSCLGLKPILHRTMDLLKEEYLVEELAHLQIMLAFRNPWTSAHLTQIHYIQWDFHI